MRPITRDELDWLRDVGTGVALVDRGRDADRPSTLHVISCRWLRKTGPATALRFADTVGDGVNWLLGERGDEDQAWRQCPECAAGLAEAAVVEGSAWSHSGRQVGAAVWATDAGRDLMFIHNVEGLKVSLASFDSPGDDIVGLRTVSTIQATRFSGGTDSRCFVATDRGWRSGRCLDDVTAPSNTIRVAVGGAVLSTPASRIRFRHIAPLGNPLGELSDQRAGKRDLTLARSEFTRLYYELSAADRGLHGVVSAAAELHPHQIGVVRRVLADPVQRYLLADEVGLGKTIEAGFIIRQRLIDAPGSVVLVLAPSALVWQWEAELEDKFSLSQLRRGGVEVASYDAPRAFDRAQTPDLVVIDEAHRVAAGWGSGVTDLAARYEAARSLAHRIPRVLLLSSTPVLYRERDLLAMLHLLDPDMYDLEAIDSFTARVRDREQIGELMLALRPGVPAFLLISRMPEVRAAFAHDDRMNGILDRIEASLATDDGFREAALADARSHVGEVYRLHRRLVRNRRAGIGRTTFAVRGRGPLVLLEDGDSRRTDVAYWLERWRTTLLEDAYDRNVEGELARAERAFMVWAGCATGDPEVLRDVAAFRTTLHKSHREAAGLDMEAGAAVRHFPSSDRQKAALQDLRELLGEEEHAENERGVAITRALLALPGEAFVVFANAPATVRALSAQLRAQGCEAFEHAFHTPDEARRSEVLNFTQGRGRRFLICDASGEEGLNLQIADCVVHVDLPLSANRVEQRIGRVDRFGSGAPVRIAVVNPGPSAGFGAWWLGALRAFGVFEATAAPLQYAIEEVERGLLADAFADGLTAPDHQLEAVRGQVVREQARIDKLDSLDALARQETDDVRFVDEVAAAEAAHAPNFAAAVMRSIELNRADLGAQLSAAEGAKSITVDSAAPPAQLFPALRGTEIRVATERRLAVADPHLSLLRPGAPLVELVRAYQDFDERAQTTAVYGVDSELADDLLAVRCDFVARADPRHVLHQWRQIEDSRPRSGRAVRSDADAPLSAAAFQRRLDSYLAPRAVSLWFDGDSAPVSSASDVTALETRLADPGLADWPVDMWPAVARKRGLVSIADFLAPIAARAPGMAVEQAFGSRQAEDAAQRATAEAAAVERDLILRAETSVEQMPAQRDLEAERGVAVAVAAALRAPVASWSGACLLLVAALGTDRR
jgi:ATP-dependent helicase HepA